MGLLADAHSRRNTITVTLSEVKRFIKRGRCFTKAHDDVNREDPSAKSLRIESRERKDRHRKERFRIDTENRCSRYI